MRRFALACVLVALVACAEKAGPRASGSGIRGTVVAAPVCPVQMDTSPCPQKPIKTTVSVESVDGEELIRQDTASDGSFRIDLDPGEYLVAPQPPAYDNTLVPRGITVTVEPNAYASVTLVLDTRLREPLSE